MKKWIIYGLLTCSLTFNIIFIIRAYQFQKEFPPIGPPKMETHKKNALRDFWHTKRDLMRKDLRRSKNSKDRLICRFLEGEPTAEEIKAIKDSLIKITVDRENRFIECLMEYKIKEKEKKRSKK